MTRPDSPPEAHARISDAGRLFALLRTAIDAHKSDSVLEALAVAAGAPKSEREAGYRMLADLHHLVASAKEEVQARPDLKQQLYLGSINAVANVFNNLNPTNAWDSVTQQLAQPMIGLEFCADQLNRLSDEALLSPSTIADLLKDVQELEEGVLGASLEPDLKQLLLRKLAEMRQALTDYRIYGAAGIVRASESALGGVVKHGEAIKKAGRIKQVAEFLELLLKLDTVVAKVVKYAQLVAPVIRGLLPPGGGAPGAS